jgi:capsular polysaccharide biosynthesis protein
MTRAELYRLVDELPNESVDAAVVLLTRAKDPVLAAPQAAPLTTSRHPALGSTGFVLARSMRCNVSVIQQTDISNASSVSSKNYCSNTTPDVRQPR